MSSDWVHFAADGIILFLNSWIIFHCVYLQHCPFIWWWTLWLTTSFGYCEQCYYKHGGAGMSLFIVFKCFGCKLCPQKAVSLQLNQKCSSWNMIQHPNEGRGLASWAIMLTPQATFEPLRHFNCITNEVFTTTSFDVSCVFYKNKSHVSLTYVSYQIKPWFIENWREQNKFSNTITQLAFKDGQPNSFYILRVCDSRYYSCFIYRSQDW